MHNADSPRYVRRFNQYRYHSFDILRLYKFKKENATEKISGCDESRKRMAFLQYGGCVYRYFVCERDFPFDQLVSLNPWIKSTNEIFKIAKNGKWKPVYALKYIRIAAKNANVLVYQCICIGYMPLEQRECTVCRPFWKKMFQTETYSVQSWCGYKCEVNFWLRTNFMENDSQSTAIRIIAFQQCIF